MLLGLLLSLNVLVCLALIGVVLLQRSEGGALGGGGGPTGLVTTSMLGDLLTRTTWVLFSMFLSPSSTLGLARPRAVVAGDPQPAEAAVGQSRRVARPSGLRRRGTGPGPGRARPNRTWSGGVAPGPGSRRTEAHRPATRLGAAPDDRSGRLFDARSRRGLPTASGTHRSSS